MSMQAAEAQSVSAQDEKKERADKIDFKMVTFSLGGKEYGIDIMNVKEIAHAGRFTYVPNAAPFVRGVYNLRGDIISIIDLRIMFHLPAERKSDSALESLLILRIDDHVFGVIVDNIDKVVGVASTSIQAPHPIFGDINVKYIKGITENRGKLYIILNVEKLFSPDKEEEAVAKMPAAALSSARSAAPVSYDDTKASVKGAASVGQADMNVDFIKETLESFKKFGVSAINEPWFNARYIEWRTSKKENEIQLRSDTDADEFLESFYSPCTGSLWSDDYAATLRQSLPPIASRSINVWNPGCGKGYETYSLACLLKEAYPEARIKIWANDSDLLAISMAPNMVFEFEDLPERYRDFMVKGRNGWTFAQGVRDSIFFEFHDVLNANPLPPLDLILCRDTLSFLSGHDQKRLLIDINEKSKDGAALILGVNELMPLDGWTSVGQADVSAYVKGSR